jgi:hypothetical protein
MAKANDNQSVPLTFGDDNPSPEVLYMRVYRATARICAQAMAKFDVLAVDWPTAAGRADARARSLQADQELELARSLHDTVVDGHMTIHPPTAQQVATTLKLADDLAKISAEVKNFSTIVSILVKAVDAFNAIHGKPPAGKPVVPAVKKPD